LAVLGCGKSAFAATPDVVTRPVDRATLQEAVYRLSRENGVDPQFVDAVVRVESAYDPEAVSKRGALGLMQLMPDTARRLAVSDPFDPEQNIQGGIREVARLIDRYSGNLPLVLAAYNAGEGAVAKYSGIPPYSETRNYVTRVMTLYTGRAYRLSQIRISPVRMVRNPGGGVVITNQPRSATGGTVSGGARTDGKRLSGGFGSQ
jgi:soluble lytic murein transglycosylase-like protein